MRLSPKADALSLAVLTAAAVLVATFLSMAYGTGRTLGALAVIMPGYSPLGFGGAVVGAVWGLVYGAIVGWLHAALYNLFVVAPPPPPEPPAGGPPR